MRKIFYLVAATAVITSGVAVLVQPKLLATGAATSREVPSMSPLHMHAVKDVSALPTQNIVDPF